MNKFAVCDQNSERQLPPKKYSLPKNRIEIKLANMKIEFKKKIYVLELRIKTKKEKNLIIQMFNTK